jgi:hypothetical protein
VILTEVQNGVNGLDSCTGKMVDVSQTFYNNWSSANTGIVTVDKYGNHTGKAAGSTTTETSGSLPKPAARLCPALLRTPGGGANVTPHVVFQGINNFIFEGTDPTVTPFNLQYVQGTPSNGTYSWSASTTSSYQPTILLNGSASPYSTTTSQITVTGNAPSSALLDTNLIVGYTVNGMQANPPATRAITVRIFRFLAQTGTIQVVPINGPPKWGYTSFATYNVYTNPQDQVLQSGYGGISVLETVTITQDNFPVGLVQGTGATTASSEVLDQLAVTGTSPLPSNFSATADQYLSVGGFFVRHNTLSYTSTGPTVTNLGPFN